MKIEELAKECKAIECHCDVCPYKKECEGMSIILEDIAPSALLDILEYTL